LGVFCVLSVEADVLLLDADALLVERPVALALAWTRTTCATEGEGAEPEAGMKSQCCLSGARPLTVGPDPTAQT
jgi:hypothetical protein